MAVDKSAKKNTPEVQIPLETENLTDEEMQDMNPLFSSVTQPLHYSPRSILKNMTRLVPSTRSALNVPDRRTVKKLLFGKFITIVIDQELPVSECPPLPRSDRWGACIHKKVSSSQMPTIPRRQGNRLKSETC
jgi:hypothetical protein